VSQNFEYFGKYILLEKLAMGGMAEVWLARAPGAGGIGKFVAIKKILPQYSDNPEFIQMFKDEASIAMNLSHSNIVSIYEFGQEKNQLFLVMDYVEGRNLRQILNKMKTGSHKFATDQISYMIKEVAAGLDHAHRSLNSATGKPLNITHRDMSPQNVMVTFEGEVKIVDFGIAKAESQVETTRTGTLKGKFGYMSPEQAEGQATDLRTDIFSLGIVLWELLANDRLFIANNEINTLKKIRECNVPSLTKLNPSVHPELERIVMKALTRDRNLRYQTASLFHRDLNKFLNRQYPDFSPHDFSVFIKTVYTDEILDLRKRLVEYAKIPFRHVSSRQDDDRTMVTSYPQAAEMKQGSRSLRLGTDVKTVKSTDDGENTQTEPSLTATETFSEDNPRPIQSENSVTRPPFRPDSSISIAKGSRPDIRIPSGPILDEKMLKGNLTTPIVVQKVPHGLVNDYSPDSSSNIRLRDGATSGPRSRRKSSRTRKPTESNVALNLIIFLAAGIITYVVFTTYFSKQIEEYGGFFKKLIPSSLASRPTSPVAPEPIIPPSDLSLPEPPPPPQPPPDFKSTASLVVNSEPSGAEIYVNGLNTGKTTPERVDVPADSPFTIKLKMERYIDYSKSNLTTAITGHTFRANMQRAMVGYVDIDVKPPVNVRIYVNGVRLHDEILPITNYAIPANESILVRAEDTVTGAASEQTVRLREDQHYPLIFKLSKGRSPSGNR
jgi:eukaryotic-like serine/threonine-protein kinase